MRAGWRTAAAAFGSISLLLANMAQNPVQAAEVKAFVTGAARPMVDILAPQFERATGHKLTIVSGLPPELVAARPASASESARARRSPISAPSKNSKRCC
jgi:hypothetical protein